ncbi:MAG: TlpA family protein disulfide reductase [Anaerolineaceae bacterium]|nr:TlpA family protein disulfide reductase [Anaerolineaceae bacterium]
MDFLYKNWKIIRISGLFGALSWILLTSLLMPVEAQNLNAAPMSGFFAPDFSVESLDGEIFQLSQYLGKVVILNLWASWCPPCRSEMPAIQAVYDEYKSQGLTVLAVNMTDQDRIENVQEFVLEQKLTFPILLDTDGSIGELYNSQALPTTFFINPEGKIDEVIIGGPMSEGLLISKVTSLLEESR